MKRILLAIILALLFSGCAAVVWESRPYDPVYQYQYWRFIYPYNYSFYSPYDYHHHYWIIQNYPPLVVRHPPHHRGFRTR